MIGKNISHYKIIATNMDPFPKEPLRGGKEFPSSSSGQGLKQVEGLRTGGEGGNLSLPHHYKGTTLWLVKKFLIIEY